MKELTKEQIEKAEKLLKELCVLRRMDNNKTVSFFGSNKDEAKIICSFLQDKGWLSFNEADQDIIQILGNENTCNGYSSLQEEIKYKAPHSKPKIMLDKVWYSTKKSIIAVILMIIGGFLLYLLVEWYKT